jgi:hypoxanthine phosphoribosyltransferase
VPATSRSRPLLKGGVIMENTKILIPQEKLQIRIQELAAQISQDYHGHNLLLIGILKGAFMFMTDLSKALWGYGLTDFETDFLSISSYHGSTESSRNPRIDFDTRINVQGRHILIVEDIIDTGHSLASLQGLLAQRQPASLKTIVLLSKNSRREIEVPIDYIGFEVEGWVEGYGLDSDEKGRGRPEIIVRA